MRAFRTGIIVIVNKSEFLGIGTEVVLMKRPSSTKGNCLLFGATAICCVRVYASLTIQLPTTFGATITVTLMDYIVPPGTIYSTVLVYTAQQIQYIY